MPPRKTATKRPDPLGEVRVEVFAALGETSLKAECPLRVAAELAARLHDELERLVAARPRLKPTLDVVPGGDALYVWDEEDEGARKKNKRLGFAL
jgi:hypothetical protein